MQGPSVYVLEALAADAAERGESDRWAECIWVAPPRNRNRSEMQLAFDEFKERFHNSPDQLQADLRDRRNAAVVPRHTAAAQSPDRCTSWLHFMVTEAI